MARDFKVEADAYLRGDVIFFFCTLRFKIMKNIFC